MDIWIKVEVTKSLGNCVVNFFVAHLPDSERSSIVERLKSVLLALEQDFGTGAIVTFDLEAGLLNSPVGQHLDEASIENRFETIIVLVFIQELLAKIYSEDGIAVAVSEAFTGDIGLLLDYLSPFWNVLHDALKDDFVFEL